MSADPFSSHEPPQSLEDERAVLGSILLGGESALSEVCGIIDGSSYYHPAHRMVHEACLDLVAADVPIDARTLHNALVQAGTLEKVGGADYIAGLMEAVPSVANAIHYAEIVRNLSVLRAVIRLGYECLSGGHVAGADSDEVLGKVQAGLAEIMRGRSGRIRSASWKEAATELLAEMEAVRAGAAESYLPTGWIDLDRTISGFKPGQLVVLGGRPSQGKSTWAMNMAVDLAARRHKPVAVMSWEMSQFEVASGVMTVYAKVPPSAMDRPKEADEEAMSGMRGAVACADDVPLWLTCQAGMGILDMKAEIRRMKQEHNICMVVVDYVQLVEVPKASRSSTRDQDVSETSRTLKALAGELGIVVLALSSLNRKMDTERREPVLSDLRECGSIEYDASTVIFLHRPHEADPTDNALKVIVAKNRGGPTGDVALVFLRAWRQFKNAEREART